MSRAGGPARQITTHEGGDYHPVWSPDGSRIAFASSRSGVFNVMVVAASGGEPIAVATNPGDNLPSWSPDGRWIAFMRDTPEGPKVFRVPAAGGQGDQITRGVGACRAGLAMVRRFTFFELFRSGRRTSRPVSSVN